jgi:cytochrome c
MKSIIVAGMVVAGLAIASPAMASEDLAKSAGCVKCHSTADKKMGPSWKDISAKYKGKAGSDAAIVAKLKGGKEHPPTKASEDDLNKIVKWALAM